MSEDSKQTSSSNSQLEEEKKQKQAAVTPTTLPAPAAPSSAQPPQRPQVTVPPRPVAAAPPIPPRPAVTPPPSPPSRPPPRSSGRRNFLKTVVAVGAILSVTPFVPWGSFLSSSVGSSGKYQRQKAVIDNDPKFGQAAGRAVNVNDLNTFPSDSHWAVTYPSSGDATLDAQNPDTFVKFELIRLPAGAPFNGDAKDAAAFVAFSKVCVHLWCSPNYNPTQTKNPNENGYQTPGPNTTTHEQYECPCHGSIYEIPDGLAKAGPASQQPSPTNAIPMLTLTADSNGDLYIEPPIWDVEHNGVIGYGRNYRSYDTYILPAAEGKG